MFFWYEKTFHVRILQKVRQVQELWLTTNIRKLLRRVLDTILRMEHAGKDKRALLVGPVKLFQLIVILSDKARILDFRVEDK